MIFRTLVGLGIFTLVAGSPLEEIPDPYRWGTGGGYVSTALGAELPAKELLVPASTAYLVPDSGGERVSN